MAYAIFRAQKLTPGSRGAGTIGQTLGHLRNHKKSAEIAHEEYSHLNELMGCTDYKRVMQLINSFKEEHKQHNKRAVKNTAAVAIELIFTYTKTKYNQNEKFLREFEKAIKQFLKKEFKVELVALARHCDEESFHFHLVVIPYDKERKRFSAREVLGDKKHLSHLQTSFAEFCKHLGLQRGISKEITKSNHKTKQEHNRQILTQQHKQQQKTLKEAQKAVEEIFR